MAKYTRFLECVFSDAEMTDKVKELAAANRKRASLEQRKKEVDSSLKASIEEQNSIIARLSDQINRGKEDRDVECRVDLDTPSKGMKTIVRLDSGEITSIEHMTDDDRQMALKLEEETAAAQAAVESTEESTPQPEPEPAPEPEPETASFVQAEEPDPFADTMTPDELPAPLSEPVKLAWAGDNWRAEIVVLETPAGFEAEVSMQTGSNDAMAVQGGTPFPSESEAKEDAAARLYRYAQKCYAEASGREKRTIRELMGWAAGFIEKKAEG